jgi:anti-sigma factor RsiW
MCKPTPAVSIDLVNMTPAPTYGCAHTGQSLLILCTFTSQLESSSVVALLGAVAVGVFGAALEERMTDLRVPAEVRRKLEQEVPKLAEAEAPPQVQGAQRQVLERALDESFVRSFQFAMLTAAGLALVGAWCAGLTIESPRDRRHGPPNGTLGRTKDGGR